jgi:hypothetical protein
MIYEVRSLGCSAEQTAIPSVMESVVDQVWVPRPQGRPRQRPASLGADQSSDSTEFRWQLRQRNSVLSSPIENGLSAVAGRAVLLGCMKSARVAGR